MLQRWRLDCSTAGRGSAAEPAHCNCDNGCRAGTVPILSRNRLNFAEMPSECRNLARPEYRRSSPIGFNERPGRGHPVPPVRLNDSRSHASKCVQKMRCVRESWVCSPITQMSWYGGVRLPQRVGSMIQQSVTMRVMAEKYERLAETSADAAERERFGEYVKLYREMEEHFVEIEKSEEIGHH